MQNWWQTLRVVSDGPSATTLREANQPFRCRMRARIRRFF